MVISQLPQLMVKSSPSEHVTNATTTHAFLQPPLPRRGHGCIKNGNSKVFNKDLNMIVETDDFSDDIIHAGGESPLLEEHEHEVIE